MNAYQTRLKILMNVRYHDARVSFLRALMNTERFLLLFGYTAVVVAVKQALPEIIIYSALGIATLFTLLLFATSVEHSLQDHLEALRRWKSLRVELEKLDDKDSKELQELQVRIAEVEVDDPPLNRALLVRAQNEILTQADASWRVKQSPAHRMFAQIVDLDKETNFERVAANQLLKSTP
jgi:hypothetical protein